ncbi:5'-nucleotidase [Desulfuromonas versatilis]|uniref:5'-nucleotidase n=1 Tax=Desulfuromonas versatilis TaxID=2802975 RepID=A0ABN6DWT3_9BACT|nr:5'-nucleotidase [Desulfuromonas versatilis]BCR04482.1 5'-nucleotidase [Desulfuromonas versatilis]
MAVDFRESLVVGISSRALFDLETENALFEREGVDSYRAYQQQNERVVLKPGTAFHLVKALLALNGQDSQTRLVEVVVMSRNSPETGVRVLNSIEHHGLDISRAVFASGEPLHPYLEAFDVNLFLSKSAEDVQAAIDGGVAAAVICAPPQGYNPARGKIRIAFDGDSVLFSDESEQIFKERGLAAFQEHERANRDTPLPAGPFARLLQTLVFLQKKFPRDRCPVRLAVVTARCNPAHLRVIQTFRAWGVEVDEAFFLGGISKDKVLKAFNAHIFFDDQELHLESASKVVPSGKVPYRSGSPLNNLSNQPHPPAKPQAGGESGADRKGLVKTGKG